MSWRMSHRQSLLRMLNSHARCVLKKSNDNPKVQTLQCDVLQNESMTNVERFQTYGHTSVPHPETKKNQGPKPGDRMPNGGVFGDEMNPIFSGGGIRGISRHDKWMRDGPLSPLDRIICYITGNTPPPQTENAEGIIIFLGGNREHPVCIACDDRRFRIKGLKDGE